MPPYRLLAIDIDGTLVNSRDELTSATREAIARAGRAGIHVVLATGRRYSRTLHLVEPLGIDVPLVTASGALVKDPRDHRTLFRAEFHPAVLCQALKIIVRAGFDPVLCGDTFDEGFDFYHARAEVESPELGEYLRLNPDCGRICPGLLSDPPRDVFGGFAMGTRPKCSSWSGPLPPRSTCKSPPTSSAARSTSGSSANSRPAESRSGLPSSNWRPRGD